MIIAIDFDGILCRNEFPKIGKPNYEMISVVREAIDRGHEVVLWTVRNGKELEEAVSWCKDYGLRFCAVNDQAPSNKAEYDGVYETPSRKVYADIYIDDHNDYFNWKGNKHGYRLALEQTQTMLRNVIEKEDEK